MTPFDTLPDTPDVRAREQMAGREFTRLLVAWGGLYRKDGPLPKDTPAAAFAAAGGTLMLRLAEYTARMIRFADHHQPEAKVRGDLAILVARTAGWLARALDPQIRFRLLPVLVHELRECAGVEDLPQSPTAPPADLPFTPIATEACNIVLRGEGCFDLPAYRGDHFWTTWWTPSAEALAALNAGVPFKLTLLHVAQWPPARLEVDGL